MGSSTSNLKLIRPCNDGTFMLTLFITMNYPLHIDTGLQIYGGPGSLPQEFKIWPITFQGSGSSRPVLFSCENISL